MSSCDPVVLVDVLPVILLLNVLLVLLVFILLVALPDVFLTKKHVGKAISPGKACVFCGKNMKNY